MRPWAQDQDQPSDPPTTGRRKSTGDSPLDALFNMASNFEAMKAKSGRKKRRDSKHKKTSSCSVVTRVLVLNTIGESATRLE